MRHKLLIRMTDDDDMDYDDNDDDDDDDVPDSADKGDGKIIEWTLTGELRDHPF